jgi:hypothetical protein
MSQQPISRRGLLGRAAAAAGLAGLAGACAPAAPPTKITKAQAGYQFTPNGFQRCGLCANFRPPMDCVLVDAPIDPHGWCRHYKQRSA